MLKKLNFCSIPVSSHGISYSSKSENFSESKVLLNFWRLENGEHGHMHEGEEILADPHLKNSSKYLDVLNSLGGKKPHRNAAEL